MSLGEVKVNLRFLGRDRGDIFESTNYYDTKVEAEEEVERFIKVFKWTFNYEYELDWEWTAPDSIDIWVKGELKHGNGE